MEQTTKALPEHLPTPSPAEPVAAPLPASEKDLHAHLSRRNDPRFRMFLILALIGLAVVGVFLWRYFSSYESTDDAQVDGHINSVSARVSGHVIKLNVEDNQYVQAGTVLVEIDPADYQVAYERAKADYADAYSGLGLALDSVAEHRERGRQPD